MNIKKLLSLSLCTLVGLGTAPLLADEEPLSIAEIAAYTPDSFSTLTAALVSTDLAEVLNNEGDFTVFAPTNAAFDAAAKALLGDEDATGLDLLLELDKETLEFILLYHVVPGALFSGDVLAEDSFETASGDELGRNGTTILGGQGSAGNLILDLIDIEASNGVVHVIDGVLLPPIEEEPLSIVGIALSNPAFSTLVAAVEKAHLTDILASEKFRFTVFAPLNSAFDEAAQAALGNPDATGMELVEALPVWQLRRILLNHVVFGERFSDSILDSNRLRTLAWGRIRVDGLTLEARNGSGDLVPELIDLEATNGVVHVVDGVLLP
jgi:transforming growth factor-beta-induced protein